MHHNCLGNYLHLKRNLSDNCQGVQIHYSKVPLFAVNWNAVVDFRGFWLRVFSILDGVLKAAPPPQLFMLNTEGRLTSGEWCLKAERVDHITIAWCEMGKVGASKLYLVSFGNKLWLFQMDGPWSYDDSKQQIVHKKLGRSWHFEMATFTHVFRSILRDLNSSK